MIYAAKIRVTDSGVTIGAQNGKPLVPILAFGNHAARRAENDRIFDNGQGHRLIRVSRKEVVEWFGRDFSVLSNREICTAYNANDYEAALAELAAEDL